LVYRLTGILRACFVGAALQPRRAYVYRPAVLLLVPASAGFRRRRADRHHLFRHRKEIRTKGNARWRTSIGPASPFSCCCSLLSHGSASPRRAGGAAISTC